MDTISNYFDGAILQHLVRGQRLLEKIPKKLPREFHLLAQTCENEIVSRLATLNDLLNNPQMRLPDYQPERLRKFRRAVANLNYYETIGIAALERHNHQDTFLNKLIEPICHEMAYPLLPPVISSLSQSYFLIYSDLNLMFVPLSEGDFLLHLPDLYHELAHPFFYKRYDSRVVSFQNAFFQAYSMVMQYIFDEQQKEERQKNRKPTEFRFYLRQWGQSWKDWLVEFFCDVFAIATVGPAFAWSHIHLFAKLGADPFHVPIMMSSTHPPDDARMQVLLHALETMGFLQEAKSINKRWESLLKISNSKPEPEYDRCFPPIILKQITEFALTGIDQMGCRIADSQTKDPMYTILNQAWERFWSDPNNYVEWESSKREYLKTTFSSPALTNII